MQPNELEFWIDHNLPPDMARWIRDGFHVNAKSLVELGYQEYSDHQILSVAAQHLNTIIITTKDYDFIELADHTTASPRILYLNIGNLSKHQLKEIIEKSFQQALEKFLNTTHKIIEITIPI